MNHRPSALAVCVFASILPIVLSLAAAQALGQAAKTKKGAPKQVGTAEDRPVPFTMTLLRNIQPEQLNIKLLRDTIQLTVNKLYTLEPNYTFHDENVLWRARTRGKASPLYQQVVHETGNHALACWALLKAGESYQNPRIRRRLNWVMSSDAPFTYDRGMRAQMLVNLPADRWSPWVRRDAQWLIAALDEDGMYSEGWTGDKGKADVGDHANSQYGSLGLWALQRAGYAVPQKTWQAIDQHWRGSQDGSTGGWSIGGSASNANANSGARNRVSAPMTAGGVAVLAMTDRFLNGPKYVELGKQKPDSNLQNGLDWLNKNFSLDDKAEESDFYYYMWTMQQVGHASGYRTFNKVDWYRQVTARLLNLQQKDGTWIGPQGPMLSTGFGLLYLARANDPLAVCKLRYSGNWNNRPHDLLNWVEWASDEYECSLFWQIVDATAPLNEMIESRMLYLAGDKEFELSQAEVAGVKRYLDAGGLLVLTPEGSNPNGFLKSADRLLKSVYGETASFGDLPEEHPILKLHRNLPASRIPTAIYDNGVRPLMVLFRQDVARSMQANVRTDLTGFQAMSNLYLYVTGRKFDRPRLDTNYIVLRNKAPRKTFELARISHSGTFDPEPYGFQRLAAVLANDHDVKLQTQVVEPGKLGARRMAFLTATGDAELADDQAASIRGWLEKGGTLWLEAAGGSLEAMRNAEQLLQKIAPGAQRSWIGETDPLISGKDIPGGKDNRVVNYRPLVLQRFGQVTKSRLVAYKVNGRPAIIFSGEDLVTGLAGLEHWGIYGYSPESAMNLVVNGVLQAMQGTTVSQR